MIRVFFLATFTLLSLKVLAQGQPLTASAERQKDSIIKARLVDFTLKNPRNTIAELEKRKASAELNKMSAGWLNHVILSVNLNEVTLKTYKVTGADDTRRNLYYPLWNVGINVPLGTFVTRSSDVKIARRSRDIAIEQQELTDRLLKRTILSLYEEYKTAEEKLKMQRKAEEDERLALEDADLDPPAGLDPEEAVKIATRRYNQEKVRRLDLERDSNMLKLQMEEIIGVPLGEVLL